MCDDWYCTGIKPVVEDREEDRDPILLIPESPEYPRLICRIFCAILTSFMAGCFIIISSSSQLAPPFLIHLSASLVLTP